MLKKIVIYPCVFLLAVFSLPANGGKAEESSGEEPLVIDWLGYNTYGQVDPESIIVKTMEERYNVRFNIWFIDDKEWERAIAVRLASGEMPDYMKLKGGQNVRRLVDQGILTPVTDEMLAMIPAYTEIMDNVDPEGVWRTRPTIDGKLYGLRKYNITQSYPTVIVWRKDWLENVGITKIPETIEEFEEAMYKFTFEDPDGNGIDDTYGLSSTVFHAVLGAFGHPATIHFDGRDGGAVIFKKDGKFDYAGIQPEMQDGLALLNKWYRDGVIDPEFITGENKGGYWAVSHSFINGKIGVTGKIMAYHWQPGYVNNGNPGQVMKEMLKLNPGSEYGKNIVIGRSPVGPDGKSGSSTWGAVGHVFAFTVKATEDSRTIPTILRMLNDVLDDQELNRFVSWGLEGEHYTIDDNGTILQNAELSKASTRTELGLRVFNGGLFNPEFQKADRPLFYDFLDETRNRGYPNYEIIQTDALSRYSGDLGKLTLETYVKIILGEIPVSEFDSYVRTFRRQGGDEVVASLN